MKHHGITRNAIVTSGEDFDKTVSFFREAFDLAAAVEAPGFVMLPQQDGAIFEIYAEGDIPAHGFNDGIAFGFRVDDIVAASALNEGPNADYSAAWAPRPSCA